MLTIPLTCKQCSGNNLVKNGCNASKNPKYKCKDCGFLGVLVSKRKSEAEKELLRKDSQARSSSRGLVRVFGLSHQTALIR
jgi:transposase-like protein